MRILIVSWYFPPANTMGAQRIGKLAKYLHGAGHDIRVLCAKDLPFSQTLPVEVPGEIVHYTPWLDVNRLPKAAARLRHRLHGSGERNAAETAMVNGAASATGSGGVLRALSNLYVAALNRPDPHIGWLPYALAEGKRVLRAWRPDIVFASAPPFTTLIAGGRLARRLGIPWVAEYRDRWAEDHYTAMSPLRHWIDTRWENAVVRDAAGFVTVSEPWAEDYRRRFARPVEVIYNGFDPDDFRESGPQPNRNAERLDILYTGILYPDRRDPTPLFRALKLMGPEAAHVRVRFYGSTPELVREIAEREAVRGNVEIHSPVPYKRALELQAETDVLLLLQWNDPKEAGNVPGKLFEYIASRRPILLLGPENGVPARILRERAAGVLLNEPAAIAAQLSDWLAEKRRSGSIPLLPAKIRAGLSRPEQYQRLERFMAGVVMGRAAAAQPLVLGAHFRSSATESE